MHKDRYVWQPGAPAKWVQGTGIGCADVHRINMEEQQTYRYLIVPDGVGCADRLKQMLSSSSAILKQVSRPSCRGPPRLAGPTGSCAAGMSS